MDHGWADWGLLVDWAVSIDHYARSSCSW
jgi:hypothetical protein